MDALQILQGAGVTVELVDGDRLRLSPRAALTDELREIAREHKAELLARLRQAPEIGGEVEASPYPWPAILGPGPWREIPAPGWAPEDLTGWRRWFTGPNGAMMSTTAARGWREDPRPELADDSALWVELLGLAYDVDGDRSDGLFGALHGLRCLGAGLAVGNGRVKLVHGEMDPGEYDGDREHYLVPHTARLVELLGQMQVTAMEEQAA